MYDNFENWQKLGKDNFDLAVQSMGAVSKGMQAIAVECAEFSKKNFETNTSAIEKLAGVKSLDKAFEVSSDYAKTSYETFVAEMTRIGELYADMAKAAYRPFEGALTRSVG